MKVYDELIKRLRHDAKAIIGYINEDLLKAADAIEELTAELEYTKRQYDLAVEDLEKIGWGEWIPVTKRLPDEDTSCLVFLVGGEFSQLSWMSMAFFYNGVFHYDDHSGEFDQITHWMPLPQPPESESE